MFRRRRGSHPIRTYTYQRVRTLRTYDTNGERRAFAWYLVQHSSIRYPVNAAPLPGTWYNTAVSGTRACYTINRYLVPGTRGIPDHFTLGYTMYYNSC